MQNVSVSIEKGGVALVALSRGKVNAINELLVDELSKTLETLRQDSNVKAVVLTGRDKFFSFGFDIPEFMNYTRENFSAFVIKFTELYHDLFTYSKPVIAAINGHCIAGGAMLATACDYRIMVAGRTKIGINELGFGSTVFAGAVEMLKFIVGPRNATKVLYTGTLFSASDAQSLGWIDKVTTSLDLRKDYLEVAAGLAGRNAAAFAATKGLLRHSVQETIAKWESRSIHQFVDIWYSEQTRAQLAAIKIHDI